jgi:hypothetical protein
MRCSATTTECDVLISVGQHVQWDGRRQDAAGPVPDQQARDERNYDVIFGDVSPSIFTADQLKLLREFIREGGGFMMIAGERYAPAEYTKGRGLKSCR